MLGVVAPLGGGRSALAPERGGSRAEVLAGVVPVDDLGALAAKAGSHLVPDPRGPIADDHHLPQQRLVPAAIQGRTLDQDRCQVRSGAAPQALAACCNLVLALLRRRPGGCANVAAALPTYAARPRQAVALLTPPSIW